MIGTVERIGSRLFWWAVSVAIGLAVLYFATAFLKRRAGGIGATIGGTVERVTQPH